MRTYEIQVDVSGKIGLPGQVSIAVSVYVPDELTADMTAIAAYPGSGLTRKYYDVPEVSGYSEVQFHTDNGFIVIAVDPMGVGASSEVDLFDLTIENLAHANHLAAEGALERLRSGTISAELPAIAICKVIGIGQSMGGCLLTVQQANHRSFDGVGILGWSQEQENFAARDGSRVSMPGLPRDADLRALGQAAQDTPKSSLNMMDLVLNTMHHADDLKLFVDLDLFNLEGDPALVSQMPTWRSAILPPCCGQMTTPGIVAPEAAAIDVPVLIAQGEVDCVPDPWSEPAYYRKANDISVFVVPRMAHMHNFSQNREVLWSRIESFARSIPAGRASL